ncbi:hypothetical protein ACLOJK_012858 [Asimina triloba]
MYVKNSKTKATGSATGEGHNTTGEEVDDLFRNQPNIFFDRLRQIEDKMKGGNPSKQSDQERIKTLIEREMSKERVKKRRSSSSSYSSRLLMRTESMHYADYDPDVMPSVDDNSRIEPSPQKTSSSTGKIHESLLPKQPDDLTCKKQCEVCGAMNSGSFSNNGYLDVADSHLLERQLLLEKLLEAKDALLRQSQSQEFLEALQIFNANRELLLKILQDPNSVLVNHAQASPSRETVLTKCGSFPGAEVPCRMKPDLMKLKHKQKEAKSVSMQEDQLQFQYFQPNSNCVGASDNIHSEITSLADGGTDLEPLPGPSPVQKSRKDNRMIVNRFKGIKQKLKYMIKESKKERLRISMDGILHKIPYGYKPLTKSKSLFDSPTKSFESDGASSFSGKNQLRRTPSLNESLDRYSHLFDTILSKEGKGVLSEGVKLGHGDGDEVPGKRSKKSFTRILSSPEIWTYYPSREVDGDAFHETFHMGTPNRISVDSGAVETKSQDADKQMPADIPLNSEAERQIESLTENGAQEVSIEESISGAIDGDEKQAVLASDANENDEIDGIEDDKSRMDGIEDDKSWMDGFEDDKSGMVQESGYFPSHELETRRMKDASTTVVQPSSELKPRDSCFENEELQAKADVLDRGPSDHAYLDIASMQVDSKDEADFDYVRDILRKSRFSIDGLLGAWYSPDQPVDPSLFEEIECTTLGKGSSPDDIGGVSLDHMLLFDLVNEVLLEIYERSFMYSHWPLCNNSSIRPMPIGPQVLEEVWSSISWHLSCKPEYFTMDYIVGLDLTKKDGWMNIQPEAECVGLELEDWIIDDLLDEVTYDIAGF